MTDEQKAKLEAWRRANPPPLTTIYVELCAAKVQSTVVEATNRRTGRRSRFAFVEHYNIGQGWFMRDLDGYGGKLVGSHDLKDAVPVSDVEYRENEHVR